MRPSPSRSPRPAWLRGGLVVYALQDRVGRWALLGARLGRRYARAVLPWVLGCSVTVSLLLWLRVPLLVAAAGLVLLALRRRPRGRARRSRRRS